MLGEQKQTFFTVKDVPAREFIEAFANVYLAAAEGITDSIEGNFKGNEAYDYPNVQDGVDGMAFIEAAVASSKNNAAWTKL